MTLAAYMAVKLNLVGQPPTKLTLGTYMVLKLNGVNIGAEAMPPQRGLHPLSRFRWRLRLTAAELPQQGGVGDGA